MASASGRQTTWCAGLVEDSREIGDKKLSRMVRDVLERLSKGLQAKRWMEEEWPFCTLGLMLLEQDRGHFDEADRLPCELIAQEGAVRSHPHSCVPSDEFLLGLTFHDILHYEWLTLIGTLKNPNESEEMQLVLDAFRGDQALAEAEEVRGRLPGSIFCHPCRGW